MRRYVYHNLKTSGVKVKLAAAVLVNGLSYAAAAVLVNGVSYAAAEAEEAAQGSNNSVTSATPRLSTRIDT